MQIFSSVSFIDAYIHENNPLVHSRNVFLILKIWQQLSVKLIKLHLKTTPREVWLKERGGK